MARFCAICGASNVKLIENLCLRCYLEREFERKLPSVKAAICPSCLSYRVKGKWVKSNTPMLSDAINQVVKGSVHFSFPSDVKGNVRAEAVVEDVRPREGRNRVPVKITYEEGCFHLEAHTIIDVYLKLEECPLCIRRKSEAKEAILQFRGVDKNVDNRLRKQILSIIDEEASRINATYKVEERKIGFDVKVSSRNMARSIAQKMKELFNAELVETFKNKHAGEGRKGVTFISVRIPPQSDKFILLREKILKIKRDIKKRKVLSEDVVTGEPLHIDLGKVRVLSREASLLPKEYMVLSVMNDVVQLMDLETYKIFEVPLLVDGKNFKEGMVLKAIEHEGKITLV